MSTTPCACPTSSHSTSLIPCDVDGCSNTTACCTACLPGLVCASCRHIYCSSHITTCTSCSSNACCYCIEKLHGSIQLLDPTCATHALSSTTGTAIASHPLAVKLPWHAVVVLKDFDPPITLLTYRYSKAVSANGTRPKAVQAEHFIPNSCFIAGTGRTGPLIPGAGNYSENDALTYWVNDDQKAGTEHKYLTDQERAFCLECEALGQFATLEQWCDFMQHTTVKSILLHRTYVGSARSIGSASSRKRRLHSAQQAAYVVRQMMQDHFENMMLVSAGTALRNGIARGAVPPSTLTLAQRFTI